MEFISEFKMPAGTISKDMNNMQTGRPFSPTMFEVVLKNFTPDVPNSISGRSRYVFIYLCKKYQHIFLNLCIVVLLYPTPISFC